jgi:hypothetical protein
MDTSTIHLLCWLVCASGVLELASSVGGPITDFQDRVEVKTAGALEDDSLAVVALAEAGAAQGVGKVDSEVARSLVGGAGHVLAARLWWLLFLLSFSLSVASLSIASFSFSVASLSALFYLRRGSRDLPLLLRLLIHRRSCCCLAFFLGLLANRCSRCCLTLLLRLLFRGRCCDLSLFLALFNFRGKSGRLVLLLLFFLAGFLLNFWGSSGHFPFFLFLALFLLWCLGGRDFLLFISTFLRFLKDYTTDFQ